LKYLIIPALLLTHAAFGQFIYPTAKKITQTEVRFGTVIEDSYKWMENQSDPDLWSWIDEQKNFTADYLDSALHETLSQRVLNFRKLQTEQNKLTDVKATTNLASAAPSIEHDLSGMVQATKFKKWSSTRNFKNLIKKDSDTYQIQAKTTHNGDLMRVVITKKSDNSLVDVLLVKFYTFIAWADDDSFYYVSDLDERNGGGRSAIFKHSVGQIQSEDQLILTGKDPTSSLTIHQIGTSFYVDMDGTIGSLHLSQGRVTNRIAVKGTILEVSDSPEVEATVLSFDKSNNGELYKLRLRDGQRSLFLGQQNFVPDFTRRLGDKGTLIRGLHDGAHVAYFLDTENNLKPLGLQDGTIFVGPYDNGTIKLTNETYSVPKKLYSFNAETHELKELAAQSFPVEVQAEKIYYTAPSGQEASIWVMRKKGVPLTANTPMILYGYGGFKVSTTPAYGMYETMSWFERGGAMAVVTLPGSLDYGMSWYNLAKVGGRIHAWDSFALAGKELIKRGMTSTAHLGILGASNGGVLVSGTMARHPELFKAAVPLVGVHDLLNFNLFTAGKYWTEDYGNPFKEDDFRAIYPLSPYHNLEKRPYPATMVMTAEFDDRVVPMHSYKYLARLQEYNTSDAPILLYNKEWGGHARASGSERESSRYVGAYFTFFAQQLGLK
jgi:prolyl oligopeptidase